MIRQYIKEAMKHARYEIIAQPNEPYYGEIPGLSGVLATGKTLAECQINLEDALDAWLVLGLQLDHPIPPIGGTTLEKLKAVA
ncbi:MAG: type II toxin-antitoxin system HicB family antitoxin [Candidatus Sumerlaeota bacterium]|nr:type II toxin-antitoxin system HicB family antitoxin [Candidatus Sumerlaeota bacterium]